MIKGDKEYLDGIVKRCQCPEHGQKLGVAWHAGEESYVIRCAEGHFPIEVVKELTPTEQHKAGKLEAHSPLTSLLPRTDLATGDLLVPEVIKALMDYAYKYDLDPYRGHIVMMYGKPYIGIDGYLYHANRSGIAYSLRSRPMSSLEVIDYKVNPEDHGWISEVELLNTGQTFTGVGIVTHDEMTAKAKDKPDQLRSPVVAKHPWQLAQKRSEWQGMRRAFPIGETKEEKEETNVKS